MDQVENTAKISMVFKIFAILTNKDDEKILLIHYGPLFPQLWLWDVFWTNSSMKFTIRFFISRKIEEVKDGGWLSFGPTKKQIIHTYPNFSRIYASL